MNTAILVRVSTNRQDTDRQLSELRDIARVNKWDVTHTFEEHGVSRRASAESRHNLAAILELAASGQIKKLLIHEVSRLGRPSIVHPFVEKLHEHGVSLYWHAQRIETLLPDGKRNPAAGIMLAVLSEMAHAEVETLSERVKSGLAQARRNGRTLGRPEGPEDVSRTMDKHKDIVFHLNCNRSLRHIHRVTGKSQTTILKVKRLLAHLPDARQYGSK